MNQVFVWTFHDVVGLVLLAVVALVLVLMAAYALLDSGWSWLKAKFAKAKEAA